MPPKKDSGGLKGRGFVYFSNASPKSQSPPVGVDRRPLCTRSNKSVAREINNDSVSTDGSTPREFKGRVPMRAKSVINPREEVKETLLDIPSNLRGVAASAQVKLNKKVALRSPRVKQGSAINTDRCNAPEISLKDSNTANSHLEYAHQFRNIHKVMHVSPDVGSPSGDTIMPKSTLRSVSVRRNTEVKEYRQFRHLSCTSSCRDVLPDSVRLYPSIPRTECFKWMPIIFVMYAIIILIASFPLFTSLESPEYDITRYYVMSIPELQRKYNIAVFELTNPAMMEEQYRVVSNESVTILHETMSQYKPNDSLGYCQMALAYNMARYRAKLYVRSRDRSLYNQLIVYPMQDMYKFSFVRHSLSFSLKLFLRNPFTALHYRVWDGLKCLKQDEKLPCPSWEFLKEKFESIYGHYPQESDVMAMKLLYMWQAKL
eukprot:Tbor_TRINITY_DN9896_c0_g1::TRINITY_DN9896_c0_g1_i1::g.11932::m.11932